VHRDAPWPAADLAIFDVLLLTATPGIQRDLVDFPAVRTEHTGVRLDRAVAEGELFIQIIVV